MNAAQPPEDAEVVYLGGPFDGREARPGSRLYGRPAWTVYRDDERGRPLPTAEGDREFGRMLRGELVPDVYVLQQSSRTGHWCYVHSSFFAAFVLANRTRLDEPAQ